MLAGRGEIRGELRRVALRRVLGRGERGEAARFLPADPGAVQSEQSAGRDQHEEDPACRADAPGAHELERSEAQVGASEEAQRVHEREGRDAGQR